MKWTFGSQWFAWWVERAGMTDITIKEQMNGKRNELNGTIVLENIVTTVMWILGDKFHLC